MDEKMSFTSTPAVQHGDTSKDGLSYMKELTGVYSAEYVCIDEKGRNLN